MWAFTDRELARLLGLTPRRAEQLRRLGLLHPAESPGRYAFREVVSLRVANDLLDRGLTVRRIKAALAALRRLLPESEAPLAELRVVVSGGEVLVERDGVLLEPTGQVLMDFRVKELAEAARETALRGLVRPLLPPGIEAERWFFLASESDEDPARWAEAVEAYRRVTALDPGDAAAWNNLGLLHHRMGEYLEARGHYERAVAADPACAEAVYNLGALQDDLGDLKAAVFWYRRALEVRPDYADAHFNLASALERLGQLEGARRHWGRYVELDPGSRWAEIAQAHLEGS